MKSCSVSSQVNLDKMIFHYFFTYLHVTKRNYFLGLNEAMYRIFNEETHKSYFNFEHSIAPSVFVYFVFDEMRSKYNVLS